MRHESPLAVACAEDEPEIEDDDVDDDVEPDSEFYVASASTRSITACTGATMIYGSSIMIEAQIEPVIDAMFDRWPA